MDLTSYLQENKVNLVPLTPGTSFLLRSNEGRWEERVLLYWMIREAWSLGNRALVSFGVRDHAAHSAATWS